MSDRLKSENKEAHLNHHQWFDTVLTRILECFRRGFNRIAQKLTLKTFGQIVIEFPYRERKIPNITCSVLFMSFVFATT